MPTTYRLSVPAETLTLRQAASILEQIQDVLWFDQFGVNPDKEWGVEVVEVIARILVDAQLGPVIR